MLANTSPSDPFSCLVDPGINTATNNNKRKRRPAGTPDPDAEVVALTPKTLMESDRYVCEICGQGFQRDQNLQMHRRRHKVPWKLLKRAESGAAPRKRVFVCPESTCLHHDPCHALGDLVGIKKHFRRKHSSHKQWACLKCSKAYAVHSDFKAHLKTCGTRGHSCDCGRVFSRVESFIEHQDACNLGRHQSQAPPPPAPPPCLSRTASSPRSSSTETNNLAIVQKNNNNVIIPIDTTTTTTNTSPTPPTTTTTNALAILKNNKNPPSFHNLDLQLSTAANASTATNATTSSHAEENQHSMQLQLSIGSSDFGEKSTTTTTTTTTRASNNSNNSPREISNDDDDDVAEEVMAEKERRRAEEARREARRQMEMAERELADAKRVRQQARAELDRAHALKDHAARQLSSTLLHLTCHACKHKFHLLHQSRATSSNGNSHNNNNHAISLECHQVLDKDLMILKRVDHDHHHHHHHHHHQRSLGKSA